MVFLLKLSRVNELIMGGGEKKAVWEETGRILKEERVNGRVFKVWDGEEVVKISIEGVEN